jgi:hypothetical protein
MTMLRMIQASRSSRRERSPVAIEFAKGVIRLQLMDKGELQDANCRLVFLYHGFLVEPSRVICGFQTDETWGFVLCTSSLTLQFKFYGCLFFDTHDGEFEIKDSTEQVKR